MVGPADVTWPGELPPTCLVSGASGGLGRAVAEQLARAGATVVITSRDPGRAAATAIELAGAGDIRAMPAGLDVADANSVDAAARAVADLTGRLDVLVNNAAAWENMVLIKVLVTSATQQCDWATVAAPREATM